MQRYNDPAEAARKGKIPKAVGRLVTENRRGVPAEMIVVYSSRDSYIAYPGSPGVAIRKATTREIDSVRYWENFQEA